MMNLPELQYQFLKKSENEMVKKYESLEALIKEMKNEYSCFQQKYATDMNEQYQSIQEQITQIKNEQVCLQQKSQTSENDIYRKFESIHGEIIEINKGYACFQQKQEVSGNDIVKKYNLMQGQITELKKEQTSFLQKQNKLEIGINKYELMQRQMKREQDSIQQQLKKSESDMNKICESTQGQITELKKEQNFFQSQLKNDMDKEYESTQGQITKMKEELASVQQKLQLSVAECHELKEQIKKQNELSEKLEVFVQSQTSINEQFGFAMKQENLLNQLKKWLEELNLTKSKIKNQYTGYITKDVFDQMISDQFNLQKQFLNDESEQQTKNYLGSLQQQTNLEITLVQFISKQEDLNNKNQSLVQNLGDRISQIETKELKEIEAAFGLIFGRLNNIENTINHQQLNQFYKQLQEGLFQIEAKKDDINKKFLAQVEEQRKSFNKIIVEFEQMKIDFIQLQNEENKNFNKIQEFQQIKQGFTFQQNEQNKKEFQQIKVGFNSQQNEQKKNVVIVPRNVNQIQQEINVPQTQPRIKPFQYCINKPQEFPNQIQDSPGQQKKRLQVGFNKYQSPSK